MYPGRMASSCINAMSRRDHSVGITAAASMIVPSRISRHCLLLSMYVWSSTLLPALRVPFWSQSFLPPDHLSSLCIDGWIYFRSLDHEYLIEGSWLIGWYLGWVSTSVSDWWPRRPYIKLLLSSQIKWCQLSEQPEPLTLAMGFNNANASPSVRVPPTVDVTTMLRNSHSQWAEKNSDRVTCGTMVT